MRGDTYWSARRQNSKTTRWGSGGNMTQKYEAMGEWRGYTLGEGEGILSYGENCARGLKQCFLA